jgi:hypothetical protein
VAVAIASVAEAAATQITRKRHGARVNPFVTAATAGHGIGNASHMRSPDESATLLEDFATIAADEFRARVVQAHVAYQRAAPTYVHSVFPHSSQVSFLSLRRGRIASWLGVAAAARASEPPASAASSGSATAAGAAARATFSSGDGRAALRGAGAGAASLTASCPRTGSVSQNAPVSPGSGMSPGGEKRGAEDAIVVSPAHVDAQGRTSEFCSVTNLI